MALLLELPEDPLRVDVAGRWLHGDEPLHPRVARLFARHAVVAEDGTYWVQLGRQRAPLEVFDTPFQVRTQHVRLGALGIESVELFVSDGGVDTLRPETLMQSPSNVLYCRIERSGFAVPARFWPQAYYELALQGEWVGDEVQIRIGGRPYTIQPFDQRPVRLPDDTR